MFRFRAAFGQEPQPSKPPPHAKYSQPHASSDENPLQSLRPMVESNRRGREHLVLAIRGGDKSLKLDWSVGWCWFDGRILAYDSMTESCCYEGETLVRLVSGRDVGRRLV